MKYESLKRNNDFLRVYKKGKRFYHPAAMLYVNKNWKKKTRLGITCSKKVGNAVKRNRAKRVILNGLFEFLPEYSGNYDIVIVANEKTPEYKSNEMAIILKKLFEKSGIINNSGKTV